MDGNNSSDPKSVMIKADDQEAKGRFSNLVQVASALDVFIFDFAFIQGKAGWLLARMMLSPQHAKRFHAVLGETIRKHEERFGVIESGPTLQ
jgi:hypothetical protein